MSREHVSCEAAILPWSAVQQPAYTNSKDIDFEHSKQAIIFKWAITCAVSKRIKTADVSRKYICQGNPSTDDIEYLVSMSAHPYQSVQIQILIREYIDNDTPIQDVNSTIEKVENIVIMAAKKNA